jgi:multiple sugar transport system substrate-binding protein
MVRLRAVGWDHERCMAPMRAAADVWRRRTGVTVEWVVRSGESFAEEPLHRVAPDVDLISYDHPFVGSAVASGALRAFDELLPGELLGALAADAIGLSHESYSWAGRQWGLATDAACQVSVVRPDLLPADTVPATWGDALALAEERPGRVTTSLASDDVICSLLTICANAGTPIAPTPDRFADPAVALPALEWLRRYARHCHLSAWDGFVVGPMTQSDEIVYGLLQWGYTNYARRSSPGPRLRFVDIPTAGHGPTGSTLGGAGLGVSAWSRHPREAAAFAAWVTGTAAQHDVVFPHGGQPGSRTVWHDDRWDDEAGGFFSGTLATIEHASLRPRDAWWPAVQRDGGAAIARGLRKQANPEAILSEVEEHYARARAAHESLGQPPRKGAVDGLGLTLWTPRAAGRARLGYA